MKPRKPKKKRKPAPKPVPVPTVSLSLEADGKRVEVAHGGSYPFAAREATLRVACKDGPTIREQQYPGVYTATGDTLVDWTPGVDEVTVNGEKLKLFTWARKIEPGNHWIYVNGSHEAWSVAMKFTMEQAAPPVARWNGTISDNGSVADNIRDMRRLGFNTLRIWLGWDGAGRVSESTIATANAYMAAGVNVVTCITPPENAASVTYPSAGLAQIATKLNKQACIPIINEPNLVNTDPDTGKKKWYWPNGDWRSAFAMASRISTELQAAGFKTASPSFTFQTPSSLRDWWNEIIRNGWTNFDYINGHNYPTVQGWATGVADAVKNFRDVTQVYRDVADRLGKKCMMDEWGMYGTQSKFAETLPLLDAIVKEKTDASAYFIMRRIEKHAKYGLHLVDEAGNLTPLGNAAVAVATGVP